MAQIEVCSAQGCDERGTVGNELVLVQNEKAHAGAKRQVKCKKCNCVAARMKRILAQDSYLKENYYELDAETRADLVQKAKKGEIMGPHLRKLMCETVTWSRIKKQSMNFKAGGSFYTKEQLEDMKDR